MLTRIHPRVIKLTAARVVGFTLLVCRLAYGEDKTETVALLAERMNTRLSELARSPLLPKESFALTSEAFARDFSLIHQNTIMVFGEKWSRWQSAAQACDTAVARWIRAQQQRDAREAKTALSALSQAWQKLKDQYPPEALRPMPHLWTCQMHPEVMLKQAKLCPVCGMSLQPIYETQPELLRRPLVTATISTMELLNTGQAANLTLHLTQEGRPVRLEDLEETHTRKIHLLLLDVSLSDYHHVHPEPAGDGDYTFTFTPRRQGPYRLWADLKPARTHVQQFSVADIPGRMNFANPAVDEPENHEAEVEGYRFQLSFAKPRLRALETVAGRLRIIGPDGQPFTELQVVMGSFGHFVGFRGFSSVLHIHPVGPELEPPKALGGPDLDFFLRFEEPGLVRLFTQVKAGGHDLFPRFVVKVWPRAGTFEEVPETGLVSPGISSNR